jgi:predicted peptidase
MAKLVLLGLVFLFLIPACKKNNPTQAVPAPTLSYTVKAYHQDITINSGGYYEALPPSYANDTARFPLLIFLHGGGELGDGSATQLDLVMKHSVAKRIFEKTLPASFTSGGKEYSFIYVIPQFRQWPLASDVNDVLNYALNKYRVDSSRIYISGLSMGGGVTWEFAGTNNGKMLAAIVPMCGASWADSVVAKNIAANAVPAWAFHNNDDQVVTVNSTWRYANIINAENPPVPVRVTIWPTGGHDSWTKASDPTYRENGMNMYEWMLQFTR